MQDLYERASFELRADEVEALRRHFDSLARLNGVHAKPEASLNPQKQQQEYLRWQVLASSH